MVDILADIPAHDDDLVGDQLSVLVVNFRWRRILSPLLDPLLRDTFWTGTPAQIEDAVYKATNLIFDLYDAGGVVNALPYVGVQVRRTAPLSVTDIAQGVDFDDNSARPQHDTSGFWSVLEPQQIFIPAGLGGYYAIHAAVNISPGTSQIFMRVQDLSTVILAASRTSETGWHTMEASTVAFLDDNEILNMVVQTNVLTRDCVNTAVVPFAARLSAYRVGKQ